MMRMIAVVFAGAALAACESMPGTATNDCGGSGHKNVKIEYGDGKFLVDAVVRVKKKRELRFKLDPDKTSALGYNYEDTEVKSEGKTAGDNWLNGSGAYKTEKYFKVCVDESLAEKGYDYTVTFTDPATNRVIGIVDPRIVVEPF